MLFAYEWNWKLVMCWSFFFPQRCSLSAHTNPHWSHCYSYCFCCVVNVFFKLMSTVKIKFDLQSPSNSFCNILSFTYLWHSIRHNCGFSILLKGTLASLAGWIKNYFIQCWRKMSKKADTPSNDSTFCYLMQEHSIILLVTPHFWQK